MNNTSSDTNDQYHNTGYGGPEPDFKDASTSNWKLFRSQRTNRFYFYNSVTKEKSWSTPPYVTSTDLDTLFATFQQKAVSVRDEQSSTMNSNESLPSRRSTELSLETGSVIPIVDSTDSFTLFQWTLIEVSNIVRSDTKLLLKHHSQQRNGNYLCPECQYAKLSQSIPLQSTDSCQMPKDNKIIHRKGFGETRLKTLNEGFQQKQPVPARSSKTLHEDHPDLYRLNCGDQQIVHEFHLPQHRAQDVRTTNNAHPQSSHPARSRHASGPHAKSRAADRLKTFQANLRVENETSTRVKTSTSPTFSGSPNSVSSDNIHTLQPWPTPPASTSSASHGTSMFPPAATTLFPPLKKQMSSTSNRDSSTTTRKRPFSEDYVPSDNLSSHSVSKKRFSADVQFSFNELHSSMVNPVVVSPVTNVQNWARANPLFLQSTPKPETATSKSSTISNKIFTNHNTFKRRSLSDSSRLSVSTTTRTNRSLTDQQLPDTSVLRHVPLELQFSEEEMAVDIPKSQVNCDVSVPGEVARESGDMDWEASEVEIQEFVSAVCQVRKLMNEKEINFPKYNSNMPENGTQTTQYFKFLIVLDSSVLMGHLKFVESLRDLTYEGFEPLVLVVPWTVLQELDRLKDMKTECSGRTLAKNQARQACQWINKQISSNHPRVKGQRTFKPSKAKSVIYQIADDCILECCLQMKDFSDNVVLLSEDVNFRNKAIYMEVQAKSRAELEAALQRLQSEKASGSHGSLLASPHSGQNSQLQSNWALNALDEPLNADADIAEEMLRKAKELLKHVLNQVIKLHMEEEYGEKWEFFAKIKPPWVILQDSIGIIVRHWNNLFDKVFSNSKANITFIEQFLGPQNKKCYNFTIHEAEKFITAGIKTCEVIKTRTSYHAAVSNAILELQKLLTSKQSSNVVTLMHSSCTSTKLVTCSAIAATSHDAATVTTSNDSQDIFKSFTCIWDQLNEVWEVSCILLGHLPKTECTKAIPNSENPAEMKKFIQSLNEILSLTSSLIDSLKEVLNSSMPELLSQPSLIECLRGILGQMCTTFETFVEIPPSSSFINSLENVDQREKLTSGTNQLYILHSNLVNIPSQLQATITSLWNPHIHMVSD